MRRKGEFISARAPTGRSVECQREGGRAEERKSPQSTDKRVRSLFTDSVPSSPRPVTADKATQTPSPSAQVINHALLSVAETQRTNGERLRQIHPEREWPLTCVCVCGFVFLYLCGR
uniref:Uncharacterized protein n=1 Tax=Cynoglossus semilaevis TaxID=244447 RepID=A0A3P8UBL4_CYNSE